MSTFAVKIFQQHLHSALANSKRTPQYPGEPHHSEFRESGMLRLTRLHRDSLEQWSNADYCTVSPMLLRYVALL